MGWRHVLVLASLASACTRQPALQTPPRTPSSTSPTARIVGNPSSWTRCGDRPALDAWEGVWSDAQGRVPVALVCRKEPEGGAVLFGAIPSGRYEGTVILDGEEADAALSGRHLRADRRLGVSNARLRRAAPLTAGLRIGNGDEILLRREALVDIARLEHTVIVGHRGASLGQASLMNSLRAIEHARRLGADGVELDVTVPYRKGKAGREPVPEDLVVHHPPALQSELTRFDSAQVADLAGKPRLDAALRAARDHGLGVVYVDPKVRWLLNRDRPALARALHNIVSTMRADAVEDKTRWLVVGAETTGEGEQRDALTSAFADDPSLPGNVMWAAEFTRGTDERRFVDLARDGAPTGPHVLSFNLLRLKGGSGGALGLLLRDLTKDGEAAVRRLPQVRAFWTVHTEAQLRGAWRARTRLEGARSAAGDADGDLVVALVITPFPHRVVHWLASTAGPGQRR